MTDNSNPKTTSAASSSNAGTSAALTDEETALIPITIIAQFPPFPKPHHGTKRSESCIGISAVFAVVGVLVGATHGVALGPIGFDAYTVPWWIIFCLIYGQAVLALILLGGILVLDPGYVPRTPETCYPQPRSIAKWLAEGAKWDQKPEELYLPSLDPNKSGDTYCTRCLVWRKQLPQQGSSGPQRQGTGVPKQQSQSQEVVETIGEEETTTTVERTRMTTPNSPQAKNQSTEQTPIESSHSYSHEDTTNSQQPPEATTNVTTTTTTTTTKRVPATGTIRYFHCNTCQRCVKHFDHHCSFFGRCIAGQRKPMQGNLVLFYGIITIGGTSYLTCLVSVLAGLLHSYPAKWVLPCFGLGLILLHCSTPFLQTYLCQLRRLACSLCFPKKRKSSTPRSMIP